MPDKKPEIITVKSNLPPEKSRVFGGEEEHRVAFWERHPDHPTDNGEVTVTGDREVEVARTNALNRALADELVVRVADSRKKQKADKEAAAAESEDDDNKAETSSPKATTTRK